MNSDLSAKKNATPLSFEEIANIARIAPKELITASVAKGDDISRDPGLLLTKKDIINIKIYEATALALPYTLEDVQAYLKFGDPNDGGIGLSYKDFLNTFILTREHAKSWAPLNDEIRLTGTNLKIFSGQMITYGNSIADLNAGLKNSDSIKKYLESNNITTLAQLKNIEVTSDKHFPGITLENGVKKDLSAYLSLILKEINTYLQETETLDKKIIQFSDNLSNNVLPKIKTQLNLVSSNTVQADIKEIEKSISERSLRIEEKSKEYTILVEKSFDSAASLNIVGLGMAIYKGVEAEETRSLRDQLRAEQRQDIEKVSKKNQTLASLLRVRHELEGLKNITFDAEAATKNLRHVWNAILKFIQSSKESADDINDTVSLGLFIHHFKLVVDPWKEIQKHTDIFIDIFREADEEYKRIHINNIPQHNRSMEL